MSIGNGRIAVAGEMTNLFCAVESQLSSLSSNQGCALYTGTLSIVTVFDIDVELAEKLAAAAANQLMVAQLLLAGKTESARRTDQTNQHGWTIAGR
jgi:hypothetical protein